MGWKGEKHRHMMAARGIQTKTYSKTNMLNRNNIYKSIITYSDIVFDGNILVYEPEDTESLFFKELGIDVNNLMAVFRGDEENITITVKDGELLLIVDGSLTSDDFTERVKNMFIKEGYKPRVKYWTREGYE